MAEDLLKKMKRFAKHASWAVWDKNGEFPSAELDPSILKNNVIILGLNRSRGDGKNNRKAWHNFHSSTFMDSRLEKVFNKAPFKGAYMTDCETVKVDGNANNIIIDFSKASRKLSAQLNELRANTYYIIPLGNDVRKFLKKYVVANPQRNITMPTHDVFHPSPQVTEAKWLEGIVDLPADYRAWKKKNK